jgi:hypothetical protein
MTAAELLIELRSSDVVLTAFGGDALQVDAPVGALSAAAVEQIRRHKPELLRIVAAGYVLNVPEAPVSETDGAEAKVESGEGLVGYIDPAELAPCPTCGTLELWQSMTGDWRCERCDPITRGLAFLERAERIRQRTNLPGVLAQ